MIKKGYVHIYTGDGKGKTTAALGLAVRAAGHEMSTYVGQFMKGQWYGELTALKDHPFITIEQFGDEACIRKDEMTEKHRQMATEGLRKAETMMMSGKYDIVILDEILVTVWFGILEEDQVLDLLSRRPDNVELVLTGRRATEKLMAAADLVSEIKEIKHYYQDGILARDGIER